MDDGGQNGASKKQDATGDIVFGGYLKSKRQALDLSLESMAAKLTETGYPGGISKSAVYSWEKGLRNPPRDHVAWQCMSEAYEVPISELLEEAGFMEGIPGDNELSPDEVRLLTLIRNAREGVVTLDIIDVLSRLIKRNSTA